MTLGQNLPYLLQREVVSPKRFDPRSNASGDQKALLPSAACAVTYRRRVSRGSRRLPLWITHSGTNR
jgi:hypothetical protein